MNLMQLFSRFDPNYQLRLHELQQTISAKYDIARYTAETSINREHIRGGYAQSIQQARDSSAMDREHVKGGYSLDKQNRADMSAMERDRFKVAHEDMRHMATLERQREIEELKAKLDLKKQERDIKSTFKLQALKESGEMVRLDKTIDSQKDLETIRGRNAVYIENVRGHNNISISRLEHENALELVDINKNNSRELIEIEHKNTLSKMEDELQVAVTRSGFEMITQSFNNLREQDEAKRRSLITRLENRATIRGDVFKIGVSAIVAEISAQQNHRRDLERLEKESELRRFDSYWNMLTSYVMSLLNSGKEAEAKAEIDRQLEQWRAI
nr:hypothetical protein pM02_c5_03 [uncultured bacterium]